MQIMTRFVVALVVLSLMTYTAQSRVTGRHRSRHVIATKPDDVTAVRDDVRAPADATDAESQERISRRSSRRLSSWRRWMERFRPHRLHGSIQFGPGFDVSVQSDLGWNWDIQTKWWLGENVCERTLDNREEQLAGTDERSGRLQQQVLYSRSCNGTINQYTCSTTQISNGRKTVIKTVYECCPGYARSQHSSRPGCTEQVILSDMMSTLQQLGAGEMAQALNATGLATIVNQGNYTVFAPVNVAFKDYAPLQHASLKIVRVSVESVNTVNDILSGIVSGHVIDGIVRSSDIQSDQLFPTALGPGTVRLNKYDSYPQQIVTANCVPLVNVDMLTSNGVIHTVNKVLTTPQKSLERLILKHPQLTSFASAVRRLGLDAEGPFTVFAPSNAAFDRLDSVLRDRLLAADGCELEILRQHIIPQVLCSAAITPGMRLRIPNAVGRFVTLSRLTDTQPLRVERANVTDADILATNGVLHVVDDILFNKAADKLLDVAKKSGDVSKFYRLLDLSGVTSRLETMNDFTMFLPSDDAVQAVAERLHAMSARQLEQLAEYHIIPRRLTLRDLHNDEHLSTLHNGAQILVKQYESFPFGTQSRKTVQCATFKKADINNASVCSGVGHIVNKVLMPPADTIMDILESDSKFTQLVQLLNASGLTGQLQQRDSPITFFAPSNQAFERLDRSVLQRMRTDLEATRHILQSHMLPECLCCAGVFASHLFQMRASEVNVDGWMIAVDRSQHTVSYGNVAVQTCDMMATNGIVHRIDHLVPSAIARYLSTQDDDDDDDDVSSLWDLIANW